MNTSEIINYLEKNPEHLIDVCEKFNLYFNHEDKENVMRTYDFMKTMEKRFREQMSKDHDKYFTLYQNLINRIDNWEKMYHLFEPEYDERMEQRWLPNEMKEQSHSVFEYRKEMYRTQAIHEDMQLDDIVCDDMGKCWQEKGGQDGMYESFPFTKVFKSKVSEIDMSNQAQGCNYTIESEWVRTYVLDSSGGILLLDIRSTYHYKDEDRQPITYHSYQLLTLGEDDGNHFLNGRRIYETICGSRPQEFLDLIEMAIKTYKEYLKNEKMEKQ